MTRAALAVLAAALVGALATWIVAPARSSIRVELAPGADLVGVREAIEARVASAPSRVIEAGDAWSVIVRDDDVTPMSRSLDWDGTLAFYFGCGEDDGVDRTSADARDLVERDADGPLYQATDVVHARVRCVMRPGTHVLPHGAEAAGDAVDVHLDDAGVRALETLGRVYGGETVLVAIRRTVVSELALPSTTTNGVLRLPMTGGDIAPMYAAFFAAGLSMPPLAPHALGEVRAISPWPERAFAALAMLVLALGLGLGARWIDREVDVARVIAAVPLGAALATLAWEIAPAGHDLASMLGRSAIHATLLAVAIAALVQRRTPPTIERLAIGGGAGLAFALVAGMVAHTGLSHALSALAVASLVLAQAVSGAVLGRSLAPTSNGVPDARAVALAWSLVVGLDAITHLDA